MTIDLRRRALLRGLVVAALVVAAPAAWAQDVQSVAAQKVAREWLALADRGDGPGSWKAAGKKFQESMIVEQWTEALKVARGPLGQNVQRTITSTTFDTEFPGAPRGTYAHVEFRTAFVGRVGAETVSLEREADGAWHVIGYSIR
jgi:hypothetical protein